MTPDECAATQTVLGVGLTVGFTEGQCSMAFGKSVQHDYGLSDSGGEAH